MEWISNLLGRQCLYCRKEKSDCEAPCKSCARQIALLKAHQPPLMPFRFSMPVAAIGYYSAWYRALILRQKRFADPAVVRWMVSELKIRIPSSWQTAKIVWVPGHSLKPIHLVETLALELSKQGFSLIERPLLQLRLIEGRSQKSKSLWARRQTQPRSKFMVSRTAQSRSEARTQNIILLDDVLTTGATLEHIADQIHENTQFKVIGTVVLAYTARTRQYF